MKKILPLIALFFATSAIAQQQASSQSPGTGATVADIKTLVSFSEEVHNFGKISYGKPVEYEVEVKNIGKTPIKLEDVRVSCGCTTPKFAKDKELAPGETTKITLGFSGYAEGKFEKFATVVFSGGLNQILKFHGEGVKEELKKDGQK
jgi:hypothetical protein